MPKTVDVVYFSSTGTTKKIAFEAVKGTGYEKNAINITDPDNRNKKTALDGDAVIIAVPVYEERVPELLDGFFAGLTGHGQSAALIAVYGNIGFGIALDQLYEKAIKCGLIPVAAAAFIGEHSFSSKKAPIATGRPDERDLEDARRFGTAFKDKIENGSSAKLLLSKGKLPLMARILSKNSARAFTKTPAADSEACTRCNACVKFCPVHAISEKTLEIDESKCLRCFACVKRCGKNARKISFKTPIAPVFLMMMGKKRKDNAYYL